MPRTKGSKNRPKHTTKSVSNDLTSISLSAETTEVIELGNIDANIVHSETLLSVP